jgi:hypothetical protein
MTYSVGFCVIKYREGFIVYPGHGGKPTATLSLHYLLNDPSHSQPVSAMVTSSQKCHHALVFVPRGVVVT